MKKLSLLLAATLAAALPAQANDTEACEACGACCAEDQMAGMLTNYEKVAAALAADNLTEAQAAATNLACCLKCGDQADLSAKVEAFSKAGTITDARTAFKGISAAIIPLLKDAGDHFVMTCPMAGADWIQTSETVANPYYGSQMLTCGSIKKAVKHGS